MTPLWKSLKFTKSLGGSLPDLKLEFMEPFQNSRINAVILLIHHFILLEAVEFSIYFC